MVFSYDHYFELGTTGISELHRNNAGDSGELYNLSGQRVGSGHLKKGVYIRRGKKIQVK